MNQIVNEAAPWRPAMDAGEVVRLLPCPFCGRSDTPYHYQTPVSGWCGVECEADRGGCGVVMISGDGIPGAIVAWNTRAQSAADRAAIKTARGEVERLREALTPSGETKAAYIGEIKYSYVDYDEFGDERTVTRTLDWTTTKDVMAIIVAHADRAALSAQPGEASHG
jgi:hypothetical protein